MPAKIGKEQFYITSWL